MRFRRLTFVSALAVLLATSAVNHAQDDAPKSLSGRLSPAKTSELKIELDAYGGELKLKSLLAPGMEVNEGDVVAEIEAPELQEHIEKAEKGHERAQRSMDSLSDSLAHKEEQVALGIESAQRSLARAKEALDHWLNVRKAERIREGEMGLESREHSIQDQEEELAQLERLYKGNDLAQESQDIVLNRSKRRLKQSKERYEIARRAHKRFVEVEIPRREEDLRHALENARLGLESAQNPNLNGLTGLRLKLESAQDSFKSASETLADLKGDADKLVLKAPHAGVVVIGSAGNNDSISQPFKVGDKLNKGQALASVIDTSSLEVTVDVTLEGRAGFQPGTSVEVELDGGAASAPGTVEAIGFIVDKSGNVKARISVDNAEGELLPGARVNVALAQ